jgi:aminoglycoside phosphotransferase (APT) family kinase protein
MAQVDEAVLATATGKHLDTVVEIRDLRRLSGGASRETWSFDALVTDGTLHELVLRRDPSVQVAPGAIGGRATEYDVLRAAAAAGVRAPEVRFLLEPADELGAGFVMTRVDGETIPRKILRDDELAAARAGLAAQCGTEAAQIHAVPLDTLPELPVLDAPAQLTQYRQILDGIGEAHPAFELGLRRLGDAPPPVDEPRLVHGDFRNGNLVVGADGLRAVLDWELAHLGDPVEDLAWCCVRSWRFGVIDRAVGGFGDVDDLLDAYTAAGGAPVDRDHLDWWEAFGTLKWGLICGLQAHTHLGGAVRSVELATLGRRIAETEWDLLRLLVPDLLARANALAAADGGDRAPDEPADADGPIGPATGSFQDRPNAAELLEAVREFVEHDAQPGLEDRAAFHARVAVNALGIVERELVLGPAIDAPVAARLTALLGQEGSPRALAAALAAGIRDGALDQERDEVVDAVIALVRAKLAIANPRYAEA